VVTLVFGLITASGSLESPRHAASERTSRELLFGFNLGVKSVS